MVIIGILISVVLIAVLFGAHISAPKYKGEKSDHFNGKQFVNLGGIKAKGLPDLSKWMLNRKREPWTSEMDLEAGTKPRTHAGKPEIIVTFVNHSTFLIQYQGLNILTDPIWSLRCSPLQFAGPKRMRPPGLKFEDLPAIDIVIISHNHYDHLDEGTIKRLWERDKPQFICPLGIGAYLKEIGIEMNIDLDWWQSKEIESLMITSVPAQHFSGRGMFDRDKTLWAGYVLEHPAGNLYFAGDSGYGPFFKEIGEHFPKIDLALIPIGAYKPRWFMSPIHVSPNEAVMIHEDVKAKKSMAMHFGTFPLADDGKSDPIEDLQKALIERGIDEKQFIVPIEGKTYIFGEL